jgi:predicted membrane protein
MKLTKVKEKETILTICVGLLVLYALTEKQYDALLYISIVLGLVGMFSVFLTSKIAWAWMKLAEGIGFVTSKIILTAVFYLILFPFAMLSRISKRDNLMLKKKESGSYYVERNRTYTAEDLKQVW